MQDLNISRIQNALRWVRADANAERLGEELSYSRGYTDGFLSALVPMLVPRNNPEVQAVLNEANFLRHEYRYGSY